MTRVNTILTCEDYFQKYAHMNTLWDLLFTKTISYRLLMVFLKYSVMCKGDYAILNDKIVFINNNYLIYFILSYLILC